MLAANEEVIMKKLLVAAAVVVSIAALSTPARAADAGAKAAIEKSAHEFVAAGNAHDPAKMAASWAADAEVINPFGVKANGRAEIQKLFEGEQGGVMKASTYKIESLTVHDICGDAALVDMDSMLTGMTGPNGEAMPPFPHHVTEVAVKKGGRWQVEVVRAFAYKELPKPE
jgi:uncharacterized protein (TIGR02246 family)